MLTNDRLAQLRKYLPTQPAPSIFRAFNIALRVRDRIAGGIPKNPDVVRAWLEAKLKFDDVDSVHCGLTRRDPGEDPESGCRQCRLILHML